MTIEDPLPYKIAEPKLSLPFIDRDGDPLIAEAEAQVAGEEVTSKP